MKLCIVIPAYNEEGSIEATTKGILGTLGKADIPFSILVVNDNSKDKTEDVLKRLNQEDDRITYINNTGPNGFGYAARRSYSLLPNYDREEC